MKKILSLMLTFALLVSSFLLAFPISAAGNAYWTPDGCTTMPTYYDDGSIDVKNSTHWSIYTTKMNGITGFNIDFDVDVQAGANTRIYIRRPNPMSYFYIRFWQGNGSLTVTCQLWENNQWVTATPQKNITSSGPYHVAFDVDRLAGTFNFKITTQDGNTTLYDESCNIADITSSFFDYSTLQLMIGADDNGCPVSGKFSNFVLSDKNLDLSCAISGPASVSMGLEGSYTATVNAKNPVSSYKWTLSKGTTTIETKTTTSYSYSFNTDGVYQLLLEVQDNKSNKATAKLKINVINLDSEVAKWSLVSGVTGELDANQKAVLTADAFTGYNTYNSTINGDEGFSFSFNMKMLGTDTCKSYIRLNGQTSNMFMRLQANKTTKTLYASMEFWQNSNSSWTPGYRNYSIPALISDEITISYIHEEGTKTMTWKITSTDGTKVYLNETYNSTTLPDVDSRNLFNEKLTFMLGGEGGGKWNWNNFVGLPSTDSNLRTLPFASMAYVNETGNQEDWQTSLTEMINTYQKSTVSSSVVKAGNAVNADLIVISYGQKAYSDKKSVVDFKTEYQTLISSIRNGNPNSVIVLESLAQVSYTYNSDVNRHALYNVAIKELANQNEKTIYADTVSSTLIAAWNLKNDDFRFYGISTSLAQNAVALSISSGSGFPTYGTKYTFSNSAKNEFVASIVKATTAEAIKALIDSPECYLECDIYNKLNDTQRKAVSRLLLDYLNEVSDKNTITAVSLNQQFAQIIYKMIYKVATREDSVPENGIKKIVVVGDSISWGACSTNSDKYRWVALVNERIKKATGNNNITIDTETSIPGTLLTAKSGNNQFNAAKDIVQTAVIDKAPDLLYIAYGINDLNANVTYESYMAYFDAYLNTITSALPNCVVVIAGLTYLGNGQKANEIQKWNLGYRELADKYGCVYADNFNMLKGSEWLLMDTLHPTDIGYFVMANAVYSTITSICNLEGVSVESTAPTLLQDEVPGDNNDDATKADDTTNGDETSTDEDEKKTGCFASMSYSSVFFVSVILTGAVLTFKKKKATNN